MKKIFLSAFVAIAIIGSVSAQTAKIWRGGQLICQIANSDSIVFIEQTQPEDLEDFYAPHNISCDYVVYGKIYTAEKNSDGSNIMAEAAGVKDGKFVFVGSREDAQKYIATGASVVDYTGKGLVIPGCTEGHGHFVGIDAIARMLPGFRASYQDLVTTIIPNKMKDNPGPFLSFGWATLDVVKFSTNDYASEIEKVSNGNPAIMMDSGGHSAVCNRTALKKAGLIDEDGHKIKDVRGGEVITILDDDGNPTNIASGFLTDEAVMYVLEQSFGAPLDEAGYLQACQNAVKELNKRGFTSYMDAYINAFDDALTYQYLAQMDTAGTLTANVMGYYTIRSYDWGVPKSGNMPQRVIDKLNRVQSLSNQYTKGHVQANGVKLFADGVVETYTGWISEEYTVPGLPENKKHGNIIWEQSEVNTIVAQANAKGMPVHVHTFGDLACNQIINAYCASPSASSLKIRNSLAHVRNISDADIARCGQNNIGIASNLIWHAGDPDSIREYLYSIMPKQVYEDGYPMKKLLNAGIVVSSSTDAPCGEMILGTVPNIIGVTVTGLGPSCLDAKPLGEKEDLLTVSEALQCLTINGAASLGLENERGSIKVGKYADFVVLDQDVLELEKTDKNAIFQTNVSSTWFEGKEVYTKK